MKKIFILLLSIFASVCFAAGCSFSDESKPLPPETSPLVSGVTSSAGLAFELSDDETYYLASGIGDCIESNIVISCVHEGKPVKGVKTFAFQNCNTITSLYLDKGIEYIESYAFFKCRNLINVTLNQGLKEIEEYAFRNCYKLLEVRNLSEIELKNGDEENGYVSFYAKNVYTDQTSFTPFAITEEGFVTQDNGTSASLLGYAGNASEVILPTKISDKPYEIYERAFYGCDFSKITFGDGVKKIGASAFDSCEKLQEVEYTATVNRWCNVEFLDEKSNPLHTGAKFYVNGSEIKNVQIAENISPYAFYGYAHLTDLTIADGCQEIGNDAFNGCLNLTNISLADTVKKIGVNVFRNCEKITRLKLPDNLESIGDGAFAYCKKLLEIHFPTTLTMIGKQAFYQNLGLMSLEIPASVLTIDDEAFGGCQNVATLALNEGLKTIGAGAFSSCKALVTVRIPHSVTSVGNSAFDRCSGLDLLIVGDGLTELPYKFAYATNQGATDGDGLNKIVIGMGVKSIGDYAIAGWKGAAGGIIYYKGTQADYKAITLGYGTQVNYAKYVYYFTNVRPTVNAEKYWHYVDGTPTLWSES